ncbi:MAG: GSCFA domain-containing protein, partial [Chitinophagales bacterium]
LKALNPTSQIIVTISPVRHLRDGVINNNRSKARLIESVHQFQNSHPDIYYFPSYELVIDCLRDYRFYDIDLAHPNTQATNIVFDYFTNYCIDNSESGLMEKFYQLHLATKHRSKFPQTNAHKAFLNKYLSLCFEYKTKFPYLNFDEEISFFQAELCS